MAQGHAGIAPPRPGRFLSAEPAGPAAHSRRRAPLLRLSGPSPENLSPGAPALRNEEVAKVFVEYHESVVSDRTKVVDIASQALGR